MAKCDEQQRLIAVNQFIKAIADCGRQFFKYNGNYACIELDDRGRVWFIDDYTKERIFTHYQGRWKRFSHGGTLRRLIELFRDHVKRNAKLNTRYFDHSEMCSGGHPWGYPAEDLERLKEAAIGLGIMAEPSRTEDQ